MFTDKVLAIVAGSVAIVALGGLGVQTWGRHSDQTDHARAVAGYESRLGATERTARQAVERLADRERVHAIVQQGKEDAFDVERQKLEAGRVAAASAARSLRDQLATATTRNRATNPADTAACGRDQDRLEALGRLGGEGAELVAEAQGLLRQRAGEVSRLLEQITIDRAACAPPKE
jgi:hypothetical protein